ncbi:MAG: AraC family transcriptional regulator [Clostridiales bacterium]|nr:AraC family transcriptional regulator [Clostridiales bacterium]
MVKSETIAALKLRCENLLLLSPCNLYLSAGGETTPFFRLQMSSVVSAVIETARKKQVHALERQLRETPQANTVLLWIDPFRLGYLTLAVGGGDARCFVTFGPFVAERISADELRYVGYKMKLGSDACLLLETFFGILPTFDKAERDRAAAVLSAYFASDSPAFALSVEDHPIEQPGEETLSEAEFEQRSFVTENYAIEAKLLSAVEYGDIEYIRESFGSNMRSFSLQSMVHSRYPNDPLREMKNLAITGNSICLRAAIKGGLNSSLAHNMSRAFAIRVEQMTSRESITDLIREISLRYTQAVREYALTNCSELIVNAVILVHRNISSSISLADIARQLHVSREHLSRRFRQEMGTTLTDYVHRSKVRESLPLLASRKYDVARIAFLFGYSSPSHYTKAFIRQMGLSPKQWQQKQGSEHAATEEL